MRKTEYIKKAVPLIIGKKYKLDAKYRNNCIVTLVSFQTIYCSVKGESGSPWTVMINRLSNF